MGTPVAALGARLGGAGRGGRGVPRGGDQRGFVLPPPAGDVTAEPSGAAQRRRRRRSRSLRALPAAPGDGAAPGGPPSPVGVAARAGRGPARGLLPPPPGGSSRRGGPRRPPLRG